MSAADDLLEGIRAILPELENCADPPASTTQHLCEQVRALDALLRGGASLPKDWVPAVRNYVPRG